MDVGISLLGCCPLVTVFGGHGLLSFSVLVALNSPRGCLNIGQQVLLKIALKVGVRGYVEVSRV